MPNPLARARAFWTNHGEWVLLGVVFVLAMCAGYGLAARDFQITILAVQKQSIADIAEEKAYLRGVIARKNEDIRRLQGIQGDLAKDAGSTAKSSTEALRSLSEAAGSAK